jgi:hypothetical protein
MNTCNCPDPPGGTVVCNENQLAICRVIAGRPFYECRDVNIDGIVQKQGGQLFLTATAISTVQNVIFYITKTPRKFNNTISNEEKLMLLSGRHKLNELITITFTLPKAMKDILFLL